VADTFSTTYVSAGISGTLPSKPPADPAQAPLTEWLASPEAAIYRGQWVLLEPDLTVVDRDLSPSALKRRRTAEVEAGDLIVFVPGDD
jgi:hypothetical protein